MMDGEKTIESGMSEEQAADFARLSAAANEPGAAAVPATEPEAGPDLAGELKGLILAAVTIAGPMLPSLKTIYTPEAVETASGVLANLCLKHGWLSGGLMGEYAEEVAALVVLGPLAFATVQGVKHDLAALKAREAKAIERAPEPVAAVPEPGTMQGWTGPEAVANANG